MTTHDSGQPAAPAAGPGDPAEYDLAAALATMAANLADAIDDNRPDWLELALGTGDLLDALVIAKLDAATETDWNAALTARTGKARPADPGLSLWETAADLSATAGDIAAGIAEGRACPDHLARARRLLDALAAELGGGRDLPPGGAR